MEYVERATWEKSGAARKRPKVLMLFALWLLPGLMGHHVRAVGSLAKSENIEQSQPSYCGSRSIIHVGFIASIRIVGPKRLCWQNIKYGIITMPLGICGKYEINTKRLKYPTRLI